LLLQLLSVSRVYPNFLAYFNEAAGGPDNGYRILIDSSYDWGQDVGQLAQLQRTANLTPLAFSYFGTTDPRAYRLDYTPAPGYGVMDDAPAIDLAHYHGYFAISATELAGGPGYNHAGMDYRPLLRRQPVARAGKTIFIYRLP